MCIVKVAAASAAQASNRDPRGFMYMEQAVRKEALGTQANALLARKDFEGAIAKYKEMLSFIPGDARIHYNKALAYGHKGDYDSAIKSIDKAIDLAPDDAELKQTKRTLQSLLSNAGK